MTVPLKLQPIRLWNRWGADALRAKASGMPRRSWNRGWRLQAISDEDLTFPSFIDCYDRGDVISSASHPAWPKTTGVDLSGSKRPGNAIVTVALNPETRRRYLLDVRVGAWKSSETARMIGEVNALYNPSVIMVEDNAYQESLIDWIQESGMAFWPKVEGTNTTGGKKHSEEFGIGALEVEFANGAWVLPASKWEGTEHPPGHAQEGCVWCRYESEFRAYPLAATSDLVMATWFARQGIERLGLLDYVPIRGNLTSR